MADCWSCTGQWLTAGHTSLITLLLHCYGTVMYSLFRVHADPGKSWNLSHRKSTNVCHIFVPCTCFRHLYILWLSRLLSDSVQHGLTMVCNQITINWNFWQKLPIATWPSHGILTGDPNHNRHKASWKVWKMHIKGPWKSWKATFSVLCAPGCTIQWPVNGTTHW